MCAALAPIIVGYDGTNPAAAAVAWASHEARVDGRPLRVLTVQEPRYGDWMVPLSTGLLEQSQALAAKGAALARYCEPSVSVEAVACEGSAAGALVRESTAAGLIVVGSRGGGGFRGLLLGSVAHQVAAHAAAPVAVIKRETEGRPGGVVVGVEANVPAQAAVEFAFQHASHRRLPLTALHAWLPAYTDPSFNSFTIMAWHQEFHEQEAALRAVLQPWRERFPDVDVRECVVADTTPEALISAATDAALLVVGTRSRHAVSQLALGSVTHTVLQRATAPTVVVGPHVHPELVDLRGQSSTSHWRPSMSSRTTSR